MLKHVAASALAAVLGLALAVPATAQQLEETSMTLPALTLGFAPTYIADEMGFWTKRGLKVEAARHHRHRVDERGAGGQRRFHQLVGSHRDPRQRSRAESARHRIDL